MTAICNVPMNKALADMDVSADSAQDYWTTTYLPRWTFWNSVRTAACAVSAFLPLVGMSQL
ncbi:anthrone oxygenase family protein [Roseobacter sp. EG26]|uniref:anthrone oxygenase family protein n=1 Tax=Roseobacter sp. EG26 TaxID=3412477 RepID=UPI003CE4B038